jgi:hypothetical protein
MESIKAIGILILSFAIWWLFIGFLNWNLNITEWGAWSRFFLVLFGFVSWGKMLDSL